MKLKSMLPTHLIVIYDNLFYDYHKDKLILLRSAYNQAIEFYDFGSLAHAQLSFLFILKECEVLLSSVESLSDLYVKTSSFIFEVKKSLSDCEKLSREIICQ